MTLLTYSALRLGRKYVELAPWLIIWVLVVQWLELGDRSSIIQYLPSNAPSLLPCSHGPPTLSERLLGGATVPVEKRYSDYWAIDSIMKSEDYKVVIFDGHLTHNSNNVNWKNKKEMRWFESLDERSMVECWKLRFDATYVLKLIVYLDIFHEWYLYCTTPTAISDHQR